MRVPFLDLTAQYQSLRPAMDKAMSEVLTSARFIGGSVVTQFETEFADYVGAKHCVGVGNGTDALELALRAMRLPSDGEVIVPANSFIGSSEAVANAGLRVRFCDVDTTYTLDPVKVEQAVNATTVAIMPVHLYGQPADMGSLLTIADRYGLRVIEDCAQAHGAEIQGRKVGTFGDAAAFSFFPGKNLGAYGDAGAIVTNDDQLCHLARMLANHGRMEKYRHEYEGRNSRLDALQARVLLVKLPHLSDWTNRRREVAARYHRLLGPLQSPRFALPPVLDDARSAYHLFVIRIADRKDLIRHLSERGVDTGIHYPIALPDQPAYEHLDQRDSCPNSLAWAQELLSLPMGEHLSDDQVDYVAECIGAFLCDRSWPLP